VGSRGALSWQSTRASRGRGGDSLPEGALLCCREVAVVSEAVAGHGLRIFSSPPSSLRYLRDPIARGLVLEGADGARRVVELMQVVESELRRVLSPHHAFRMFLAARRISRGVECVIGKPQRHLTWIGGRRVLELAVWKFGRRDGLGVRPQSEIVNHWMAGELEDLALAYVLALTHYNLSAWYRRICKGERLRVAGGPGILPWTRSADAGETDRLIQRWEARVAASEGGLLRGLGQVEDRSEDRVPVLFATWAPLDLEDAYLPLLSGKINAADVLAFPAFACGGTLERVHSLYGEVLAARGFTLWDAVAVMLACTEALFNALGHAERSPSDRTAALASATVLRRGYLLSSKPADALVAHAQWLLSSAPLLRGRETVSCRAAVEAMTAEPGEIDLHERTPWVPIHRIGDAIVYDLIGAAGFLQRLVADFVLPDAGRLKATRVLEAAVHAGLSEFGSQPIPSGKELRVAGKTLTDIDASCVANGVFVVADTYSAARTTSLDTGEHARTRNRWEHLKEKLKKWRGIARALASNPIGSNYDLHAWGVRAVLPVVITDDVEWLADDAVWLTADCPQICTPEELFRLMSTADTEELLALGIAIDDAKQPGSG
jgi:hypothetical protein